jgi:hypothetical protein
MPTIVTYDVEIPYRNLPVLGGQPVLEVKLLFQNQEARALGIVDSGSNLTVFSAEIAQILGIDDLTEGDAVEVSTIAPQPVTIYRFPMEIEIETQGIRSRLQGQVCFHPGRLSRNLLGKDLFFHHFQIGFRDRHQRLLIALER